MKLSTEPMEPKPPDKPENIIEISTYKYAENIQISNLKRMYHPSMKRLFLRKRIFFFYLLVRMEDAL